MELVANNKYLYTNMPDLRDEIRGYTFIQWSPFCAIQCLFLSTYLSIGRLMPQNVLTIVVVQVQVSSVEEPAWAPLTLLKLNAFQQTPAHNKSKTEFLLTFHFIQKCISYILINSEIIVFVKCNIIQNILIFCTL